MIVVDVARTVLGGLFAASIWHSGAIPKDEWKYRHLKRVWLPVYDFVAMVSGTLAFYFGSRLLYSILDAALVDVVGILYATIAAVCLLGVAFPKLWGVEIAGKVILVGLIVGYIAAIGLYSDIPAGDPPSWFIMAMLAGLLPMPMFRLGLLGEEQVVRRLKRARHRRERIA